MQITKEALIDKLKKVVNKLVNLNEPNFDKKLLDEGDAAISKGVIARDFGIKEWDWPQGVGIYGLWQLGKYKKTGEYNEFLYKWYVDNINFGLPSRNVNTTAPLLTLVELCDVYNEKRFEDLCLDWANWLMNDLPRTKENGFQHVTTDIKDRNGVILNESQLWIDTLFMMVLFLNKMGVKYNKKEWIEESIYQVLIHIKYLYEKKNGLFHHGWSFKENSNFGEVFWCRGNSWFTNGIMDFIENSGEYLDEGTKTFIINTYKAQVDALIKLQSENGLWHTVLDDPTSYVEVSGSSAIAAGILKGVRSGILDESYRKYALKAIEAILNNVDEDGTVLNVSGGTGIGYNKEHYKNIIVAPMAYGQSLAIIALTEALYHI
ncbi:MAG: glycoside hydrolase family 105 protein [Clostridium thermopalmarium]|uniref:glycoside hydrolase family 88/105 protein n=1 Tax=Clostridium thermopalmarium TaxID=29373 RepID=UPI002352B8B7|nr:glycoside hydrolase family 88 protein [Clostridium thermopalmarium]MBE6043440.1 glycoside hydrolase family 105 protein [Clostridium thermopalmarium]